jgi:hypothetical protein
LGSGRILVTVWDQPAMGVDFKIEAAQAYLAAGDEDFFA